MSDVRDIFPAWEWQERGCKYIANAMGVYDWHGIAWAAPCMDQRICDVWSDVRPELRSNRELHRSMVERLNADMPSANESEYQRSNLRIALRILKNAFCLTPADFAAMWSDTGASMQHTAKLIHGEGWHARMTLQRIKNSFPG